MKVEVKTTEGAPMTAAAATLPVGSALRIAPAFVATTCDDTLGIETTLRADYSTDEGRYIVGTITSSATRAGVDVNNTALRQIPVAAIVQAAAPHCIAVTLDDPADPSSEWATVHTLTHSEGRIIPDWLAQDVVKRGNKRTRMDVVEILYGTAALAGLPPVKAVQTELSVPHRTAADWIKKARRAGRLEGMSFIIGRQADG